MVFSPCCFGVGRWVGGWVGWIEEEKAVGMSYCEWGFGWVGGRKTYGFLVSKSSLQIGVEREEDQGERDVSGESSSRALVHASETEATDDLDEWVGGWVDYLEENHIDWKMNGVGR